MAIIIYILIMFLQFHYLYTAHGEVNIIKGRTEANNNLLGMPIMCITTVYGNRTQAILACNPTRIYIPKRF